MGLGPKMAQKSSKIDRGKLRNLRIFERKLFFGGADFWGIFEIEKNEKKVGRRGWWDPGPESARSTGKERSKGGTKLA